MTLDTSIAADGEVLDLGRHRLRFLETSHVHHWDSMMLFDETTRSVFPSVYIQPGDQPPVVIEDLGAEMCEEYRVGGIFEHEEPVRRVVDRKGVEMHGVIVQVRIDPSGEDEARRILREVVVPMARGMAGFTSGTWLRALEGDGGRGLLLFESEEAARAAAEQIRSEGPPPGAPVTLETVDAYEVLAQA